LLVDDKEYCTVKVGEPYLMPLNQIYNQTGKHLLTKEEVEKFDSDKLYLYPILKVKLLRLRRKKVTVKQKLKRHKTTKKIVSNSAIKERHMKKHILRVKRRVGKAVYMDISKPYPNEHAARLRNPGDFKKESFRSHQLKKGLRRIAGRLKSNNKWETQAYRFHKDSFTVSEAKEWLRKNKVKYIKFEPATNSK